MNARPRFGLMSSALLAVLLFSIFTTTRQVQANSSVNVDISIFHDALAPYGNWVNHRTYGKVWYPRNVARDWRPYTDGYWAHTDDYGWLWVSYQPWGWAPFHYGRWAWDNWYGWVWVPGRTWAPAWVFWRSGGGYAAWAPMPPNVVWQPNIGLNISYFNYDRDLRWDSWVAVREHDLPYRNMNRRICPPRQNRQIINVTNYINNVTIVNNTIINQGVPVKQIEAITHKPVVPVVPIVHDKVNENTAGQNEGRPNIIRLPMALPTPEEIHHNEELARQLDGKNPDGTRTKLPSVADSGRAGNQVPRVPGRLAGVPAPVQSPYATPEQPNPLQTEPVNQPLPLPAMPETPLVGLGLDSGTQHKKPEAGNNQEALVPVQTSNQQPSANVQQAIPVPSQTDGISVPAPVTDQQTVSTDAAPLPSQQNEPQPLESANRSDVQQLQDPGADQQQIQQQAGNSQRQQQIDQLQEESARRQDKKTQQEIKMQPQQTGRTPDEAQQVQQQEAAPQQDMQNQPQMEMQQQQTQRTQEEAQQVQQQEAARQQDLQNQQQLEMQQQQAQRAQEEAQQVQQQEAARQQDIQNQQQLEMQPQQAQHAQEEAQQMQQQEAARQQDMQNQQQLEKRRQQTERERDEAQQMQKQQEAAHQ